MITGAQVDDENLALIHELAQTQAVFLIQGVEYVIEGAGQHGFQFKDPVTAFHQVIHRIDDRQACPYIGFKDEFDPF